MKIILKTSTLLFAAVLLVSSCKKKLDEAYLNPNAPTKVAPETLLPPIEYNMAQNLQRDYRFLGGFIQNWHNRAGSNVWDRMGYAPGSDQGGDIWRMHYWLIGQNCNRMIDWATEDKKWDYVGAGKAIQAWSWLTLTDYHGDVILKEAFNTSLITFHYDTQQDVYAYVRKLCFESLDNLSKTGDGVNPANFATGDTYFLGGDVNKWKKFVYGVLARSYNHLSNKADYKPDSVIYYCDKAMTVAADDANIKFVNNGQNDAASFFGPYRGNMAAYRQGQYSVDLLTGANPAFAGVVDPRRFYFFQNDYAGNPNFYGVTAAVAENSNTTLRAKNFWGGTTTTTFPAVDSSKYIFRDNGDMPIMTACEIQFMKAEAAFRKGDKATALTAYTKGIDESFNMLSARFNANIATVNQVNPAVLTAYKAQPGVIPTAANLTLTHIMLQKYIALWGYGMTETWVDMRRYHYLDLDPLTGQQVYRNFIPPPNSTGLLYPDNSGKLVYRVRPRYNSEYVWNVDELNRIGAIAADYHTVKCWFSEP